MRIAVIGGGPGGLYFAALAKQLGSLRGVDHEITVWERNAADDTFVQDGDGYFWYQARSDD